MIEFLQQFHPVTQALIGGGYAFLVTALGAACIYTFSSLNRKLFDGMLGFSAGIMLAASVWSLLLPAIEMSALRGHHAKWMIPACGFLVGGLFLRLVDKILPHIHPDMVVLKEEGIKTHWQKSTLLVLAITLHNIPEGLAIGVAFGAAGFGVEGATLAGALALAIGIGIQDFPEGFAVAMPLRKLGKSVNRSFFYGALSGIVEPIAAVIGAAAVMLSKNMLPYALSFAAGAMVFVVIEEVIPEAGSGGNEDIATTGAMIGFALMMVLDVAFS
ncbi:MAG: ZIP family metal transporter [Deltaproteobacteria bacterium CG11_big_fil_rev_8_21_14_0_20_49_13]|nr:MAG: ZIP family metal transporter [Deltaproteobacteria bacterium CG11_big_fil_rev_8_21_14_0_20_49_13]